MYGTLLGAVRDGAVIPWEVVPSIKLQELVSNHTELPGDRALYTAVFVLAIESLFPFVVLVVIAGLFYVALVLLGDVLPEREAYALWRVSFGRKQSMQR